MKQLLLGITIGILITSCADQHNDSLPYRDSGTGIAVPSAIQKALLPEDGTLRAQIFLDNGDTPIVNQPVDPSQTDVTFTATVTAGSHTFTIRFQFDSIRFGTVLLAQATSGVLNLAAGDQSELTFVDADYQPLVDSDNDGLTNIAELEAQTDPNNPDRDRPVTNLTADNNRIGPRQISLICTDTGGSGCDRIFYTTNGSEPTIDSTVYSAPVALSLNRELRFFSMDQAGNKEAVRTYTIPHFIKNYAPGASPQALSGPFNTNAYNHYQLLYSAAEIDGNGYISGIRFRYDQNSSAVSCPQTVISLGQTSLDDLTTTFGNNVNEGRGSQKEVFTGTLEIPAGNAGEYINIPLNTAFLYNGVDNLVLEIERSEACSGDVNLRYEQVAYNGRLASFTPTDTTGSLTALTAHTGWLFIDGDFQFNKFGTTPLAKDEPFYDGVNRKIQQLVRIDDINGSGPISALGFVTANTTAGLNITASVRLGHSTLENLTPVFADNFSDTPVPVLTDTNLSIRGSYPAGETIWIPLTENTFSYNGSDNLLIEMDISFAGGATTPMRYIPLATNNVFALGPSGATQAITVDDSAYLLKLRFGKGAVHYFPPRLIGFTHPFTTATNSKRQLLYQNTELGSAGRITKVGVRLVNPAVAASYPNFELTLGHTNLFALGSSSFSGNMSDPTVVYSGTYAVTTRLAGGDWLEITLDTPFDYDGERNLVVQFASQLGTATNSYVGANGQAQYTDRMATAFDNTTDTPNTPTNDLVDLRLITE